MINKILIILTAVILTSCTTLKDKIPERQACTGSETNKTLTEVFCKKQ